jgi:hypothetical protein
VGERAPGKTNHAQDRGGESESSASADGVVVNKHTTNDATAVN